MRELFGATPGLMLISFSGFAKRPGSEEVQEMSQCRTGWGGIMETAMER